MDNDTMANSRSDSAALGMHSLAAGLWLRTNNKVVLNTNRDHVLIYVGSVQKFTIHPASFM
jgi:hypothetical protein